MHSVVETADLRDVEQVIRLLTGFAESLADADEFTVKI
jgi:endoglucanase